MVLDFLGRVLLWGGLVHVHVHGNHLLLFSMNCIEAEAIIYLHPLHYSVEVGRGNLE
jgi:hypothetical protein